MKNIGEKLREVGVKMGDAGNAAVKQMMDKIKNPPSLDEIKGAFKNVGSGMAEGVTKIMDGMKDKMSKAPTMEDAKKIIAEAEKHIEEAYHKVADSLKPKMKGMQEELKIMYSKINETVKIQ